MSDADTLARLVGEILERLFGATVGGQQGPTAAALRDAFYRDRYEALTGQRPPPHRRRSIFAMIASASGGKFPNRACRIACCRSAPAQCAGATMRGGKD